MTVDLCMAYMGMFVLVTLTLMQGHIGSGNQKFSVELFQQLSKQELFFYVTLTSQTFIWLDHLVLSLSPRWGTADAEIKCPPGGGTQGYQTFPLSEPVVGRNTALHAASAYMASTYLDYAFPAHSTSFSLNVFNPQRWNVV